MPESEDLSAIVARQNELIMKLHETIAHQVTEIDELQQALRGRRGGRKRTGASYEGLGARVEAILGMAQAEAESLREEARQAAAARIAEAEREAARIRAEAGGLPGADWPG